MPTGHTDVRESALAALGAQMQLRLLALPGDDRGSYVGTELAVADRVLSRIRADDLAAGPLFCEWGSGLGGVSAVAALNGFSSHGIEIQRELVVSARAMAADMDLPMRFAQGTFLLPGDEDLAAGMDHTDLTFGVHAWDELGLSPTDCDVVFAYPWPGEEACVDGVFARHACPGALLLTFHDWNYALLQRKQSGSEELLPLGWI